RDLIVHRISQEVAAVLRLPPIHAIDEQQGLFEMGLDSLMAVELKSRLEAAVGRSLPSTLTFNYPTVAAMTAYLLGELALVDDRQQVPPPVEEGGSHAGGSHATGDDALTEDELAALLAAKLDQMH
ncbi:MAG: acyl carrier protein, partial [Chloroflexi bacterium]|nr:acyl carrier protein [Chloroflexota bacterium]